MRRTVATLLVVASPLLVAVPGGRAEGQAPGRAPAGPSASAVAVPATVAPPAVPVPAATALPAATAVERITARVAAPVRLVPRTVRHAAPSVVPRSWEGARAADVDEAAYAARLQAQLCLARTIFCGLDRNGRYPIH